jgi:hypothetical protein
MIGWRDYCLGDFGVDGNVGCINFDAHVHIDEVSMFDLLCLLSLEASLVDRKSEANAPSPMARG